jgi:hypothetical protein
VAGREVESLIEPVHRRYHPGMNERRGLKHHHAGGPAVGVTMVQPKQRHGFNVAPRVAAQEASLCPAVVQAMQRPVRAAAPIASRDLVRYRHLKALVQAVLANDRAVVASIQSGASSTADERMTTMTKARIEFKRKTKGTIALRSGYRCAHPECEGRTTVGPAKQPDKYENTGRASHIFAAANRGPRGRGNLSPDELRSVANGIWLCAKHADQVDENNGRDYPPPVLLGWKAVHEFKIAREHGAMLHPFGWIESLHIIDAPVFKPDQRITLAKANVIVGGNGVGKTAICEWLWSLKDSSPLWRWGAYPGVLSMDEEFLSLFLKALSSPDVPFQSIVVTTQLEDDAMWAGWQVIRLNRPGSLGVAGQLTEIVVGDMHTAAKAV